MKQLYFTSRTSHVLCVKFRFLLLLTILLVTYNGFGQRNNCDNNAGGEITVNSSCTYTTMYSNNNTDYWNGATGCNASDRDDVWAWFDATNTTTTITYNPYTRDAILTIFNSACSPTMSSIACADDFGNGGAETITLTTVIGNRYRIRVQRYSSDQGMAGDICVYSPTPCTTPTQATSLSFNTITDTSISGSFTNSGADNYLVLRSTSITAPFPGPVNGTSYTIGATINGGTVVDNDNNTTFTDTGLTSNTLYYYYVYAFNDLCTGGPLYATPPLSGNQLTSKYCTPDFANSVEPITNVNFVTINNTTSPIVNGTPDLEDFTATISTNVTQNSTHTITVEGNTNGNFTDFFRVFFDWNQNGVFTDLGESTFIGTITNSTGTDGIQASATINVPIGATVGSTVMRVMKAYGGDPTNPCSTTYTYGQAEDYTINVTTSTPCSQPIAKPTALTLSVSGTTITGNFTAAFPAPDSYLVVYNTTNATPSPADGTTYTIGGTVGAGNIVADTDANTTFSVSGLANNTTYYFYVFPYNNSTCTPNYLTTGPLKNNATTTIGFCTPSSTNTDLYINDFSTTGGATNITNNSSGIGITSSGYSNYTAQSASQTQGGTVYFSADFEFAPNDDLGFNIWVDFNDNGDFTDAGEKVYASGAYVVSPTGAFNIPLAAPTGSHRMRIRGSFNTTDPDSCGNINYGEAEDYTLIVTLLNCTANPQSLTAISTTTTTATVSWNAPSPPPGNGYEYIISTDNSTVTPTGDITGTTIGTSIDFTGLTADTTYYVFVRGVCNATDDGVWITASFSTGCADLDTTPNSCEMVIDEVGINHFATTPYDSNPGFRIDCNTTSVDLATNAQMYETTSYDVIRIPYATLSSFGASVNNTPIADDDLWATSPTALGFPFCFYDNEYEYTLAGANSMLTFDVDAPAAPYFMTGANTPGSSCGYDFSNSLPSTAQSLFEQTIYGVYHDIDPRGLPANSITTRTQGVAGCRLFIAEWKDIPMFGDATRLYSGKMVLYETTNIIEVHVQEKRIENGDNSPWNDGNALIGIQGDITPLGPNNQYAVAPCRNGLDDNWETTNEAWRFVPSGNSMLTGVEWYTGTDTSGTPDATTDTYTATAPGTYTAISTYATCGGSTVTLTDQVVITDGRKIWNGSVDEDWYEAANWTPVGIPTSADCVNIPNPTSTFNRSPKADKLSGIPIPLPPAEARTLALSAGAYLEIETETELIVQEWVTVQNTGILNLKSSSSLIQVDDFAANSGNIYMQRSPNFDESALLSSEYVYWSSPVTNFQVTAISPASSQHYNWTPTVANGTAGNHGQWLSASGTMTDGTGYIVRGLGGTPATIPTTAYAISNNTALFSGEPNNGIITKPIFHGGWNGGDYSGIGDTATNEDDNWNLIGNPYPSAISANAFTNLNTNINGTVYVWPHKSTYSEATTDPFYEDYVYNYDGNDYIEHNNTGSNPPGTSDFFISSGQAFFVMMNHSATSGTNVTFNNSMRQAISSYNNDTFFRTNNLENDANRDATDNYKIWLDLLSPNNITNTILVGYVQNATNDFDRLFDGYDFSNGDNSGFYSLLNDETLSIQGRSLPFLQEDIVPLGMIANETGNHTIAINTLDGLFAPEGQNIYIEDTALNIIHDIRLSPYTFTIDAGVHNNRFVLRYTNETLSVNQLDDIDSVSIVAPKNEYIKITSTKNVIKDIVVYDLLGRVLIDRKNILKPEVIINDIKNASGAYIVKVTLVNGLQKTQKVILK